MTGKGLGPGTIREFIDQIIFVDPAVSAVITDPEENNLRSLRAFKKAAFTVMKKVKLHGESFQRCVVRLNHAHGINATQGEIQRRS
jgi:RimJ/RimL family protein N-acetyltransferase